MDISFQKSKVKRQALKIIITGSKSETNRLLLLQALYPNITIENSSKSDDSDVMIKVLSDYAQSITNYPVSVHHAGTAMRFLTAFFAIQEGEELVLTGSSRMEERPIKILVDALRQLGAAITYEKKEGFPPLRIKGKKLTKSKVKLEANVSSQYISALLLIAPKLENGLELLVEGPIASLPYIKMTLALLNEIGIETSFENNIIKVGPAKSVSAAQISVESDWSSASYFYSIVALAEIGTQITLSKFKKNSLQGDAIIVEIYKDFGVKTVFNINDSITISKIDMHNLQAVTYNLVNAPDIAQTIAVTCFGLGIACHLSGLHTLKIKETDRVEALKNELIKLGAIVSVTTNSLSIEQAHSLNANKRIATYQDHRMAMAFAPLALRTNLVIEEAGVVSKSYPSFWKDLKAIGFIFE